MPLRYSSLIIATGLEDILPEIKGIQECRGKSVVHCPYCLGYELKNKHIGILSGEKNMIVFAGLLLGWTDHLTIFTNGDKLSKSDLQWFEKAKNITVVNEPIKGLLHQEGVITRVSTRENMYDITALFTTPKHRQKSNIAEQLGCKINDDGLIKTETS